MYRLLAATVAALMLLGCGPDRPKCTGSNPDFKVTLKLSDRPLPADTVVHVMYGGAGTENYVLAAPTIPEVVFCNPADENGNQIDPASTSETGEAGASGAGGASSGIGPVPELVCALWTGGYAKLQVSGTGLDSDTEYPLSPTDACVVVTTVVLDSPDAG